MLKKGDIKNNRYKVIRQIGKGGTSKVYLCSDNHIKKYWAMKEISRKDHLGMKLASREVDMLRSIDYKMFPRIVDAFMEDEALYIISDYVEGVSLDKVLKEGAVKRSEACRWLTDISKALNYLHGLSPPILYLDLKPENILLKSNGELAMIDFGIAGRITGDIIPMGTLGYAAPEQYNRDVRMVDERTDIYALGKLYYALRTGMTPDKDSKKDRYMISAGRIFNKKERLFIYKCIEEDANYRFQSMTEVIKVISRMAVNPFKSKRIAYILLIIITVISLGTFAYQKQKKELIFKTSAKEMIDKAEMYKENGNYTGEGIRVIEAFINGDCLAKDTKEKFSLEVARYYFENQKDYKIAERYFRNLSLDNYPEAGYYIELCRLMQVFNFDEKKVNECVGRLYGEVFRISPSKRKYDDILFVSKCYEEYAEDRVEGIKKSLAVLEDGLGEMDELGEEIREYEDILMLRRIYEQRMELLMRKAEIAINR